MTRFASADFNNQAQERNKGFIALFLGRDWKLAYTMLMPLVIILLGLIAYPFISSVILSLQAKTIGSEGRFIGLENFWELFTSPVFPKVLKNTLIYTIAGVSFKFLLGMTVALILNQAMKFRNVVRALVLLPWTAPVVVGCFTWRWILDDLNGVLNYLLMEVGLIDSPIAWLADPSYALMMVILVVIWQGTPFYILNFLAGLSALDHELYEAAAIDGANTVQRFFNITLPGLKQVIVVTVLLSSIWTYNDIQFVFILTRGGPVNTTMTFPMLAFSRAIHAGELGMGAATALSFTPFLIPIIIFLTIRLLRTEE
jgi:multiple sugar transport system permease protein